MTDEIQQDSSKNQNITTWILVALLVVAAFLLGSLWTKTKTTNGGDAAKAAQVTTAPKAPEEVNLGKEDFEKVSKSGAASKGKEYAKVTIVEFSDFQCPYCAKYSTDTYVQIMKTYGDKIRYVFHDYPLSFHKNAQKAAEAARCAGDQDKYWEMHDKLFAANADWAEKDGVDSIFAGYAQSVGADKAKFTQCLSSGKFTQAVKDDLALGTSIGVSGTPAFFINGEKIVGAQPFENFKTILDRLLQ